MTDPQESIVDIKGHQYRYVYEEESGKTTYMGPVGSSPEISEAEFLKCINPQTETDKQALIIGDPEKHGMMIAYNEDDDVWYWEAWSQVGEREAKVGSTGESVTRFTIVRTEAQDRWDSPAEAMDNFRGVTRYNQITGYKEYQNDFRKVHTLMSGRADKGINLLKMTPPGWNTSDFIKYHQELDPSVF